jgi:hypothetical protein
MVLPEVWVFHGLKLVGFGFFDRPKVSSKLSKNNAPKITVRAVSPAFLVDPSTLAGRMAAVCTDG